MSDMNAVSEIPVEDDEPVEWVVRKYHQGHSAKSQTYRNSGQAFSTPTLPVGFPFVIDNISGAISELIFFYLFERHFKENASLFVENKLCSYAFDCKDWLTFLDAFGIVWHQATVDDLENYVGIMNAAISPTSGEEYRTATPRRRISTIEGLYKWARERKIYDGEIPINALLLPTAKAASDGGVESRRKVTVTTRAEEDEPVHVMEREQARAIINNVGPLPSDVLNGRGEYSFGSTDVAIHSFGFDIRTSRDRLGVEYAHNSGLRVSEVRNLNCRLFENFKPELLADNRNYKIRIVGKGRKPRRVDVPGWLIKETLCYIAYERHLIASTVGADADAEALLLNPTFTRQHAGRRVTVRTLERKFSEACVRAGQSQFGERTAIRQRGDRVERNTFVKEIPDFVFHDLRHTYAVWTYYARKKAGDNEPWLYIQARLGHEHLTTTMDKYLKAAGDFEAAVTDAFMEYINGLD
jgi:integrase/recombinase XerC